MANGLSRLRGERGNGVSAQGASPAPPFSVPEVSPRKRQEAEALGTPMAPWVGRRWRKALREPGAGSSPAGAPRCGPQACPASGLCVWRPASWAFPSYLVPRPVPSPYHCHHSDLRLSLAGYLGLRLFAAQLARTGTPPGFSDVAAPLETVCKGPSGPSGPSRPASPLRSPAPTGFSRPPPWGDFAFVALLPGHPRLPTGPPAQLAERATNQDACARVPASPARPGPSPTSLLGAGSGGRWGRSRSLGYFHP